ncbi:sigma-G-dependent sporulation-specific acid-soluble spore protein CsgA [Oceanobacillus sp. CF4.6]|uniref:sigma-G-dependent sporulation-specific acid-soluble spore protein CsgA n=1 Tax=Oceanobacillus sp. CF4.6 TaxID=3373080 RepID=UPI003EE68873
MIIIDQTLQYLRESLSNYMENDVCQQILSKIEANNYTSEESFVSDLDGKEMDYLDMVLENELDYAKNVQDDTRVKELNEVYEQLF